MTNHHQDRSNKVVEAFKGLLDENVSQQISDSQYDTLALMISEAMSEELAVAAEMMEDVIKKIRIEANRSELEL
jgi:hypothetical protein